MDNDTNPTVNAPALSDEPAAADLRPEAVRVRAALAARGLETPMIDIAVSDAERLQRIQSRFTEILELLGLDLSDDSLQDSPKRIAKMYVNEIFGGLDYRNFPKLTVIENKMRVDEMVKVSEISVSSTCEHHFVSIDGAATVAYIPREKVIGLSKINRIVRFFAQRPQVQERLTEQILVALQTLLETRDVAVTIAATHFCVKSRGVMDANSITTTTALGGVFKTQEDTRKEFLMNG
ncbi:MAG: GTP cyclohydrolase I FolE [Gammaproteobacteria bacterium]|jgi:GTP cyclohydrolase I|nr:GTP cyclohydrolase I FolE [Gammaproteobacteria bacterium]